MVVQEKSNKSTIAMVCSKNNSGTGEGPEPTIPISRTRAENRDITRTARLVTAPARKVPSWSMVALLSVLAGLTVLSSTEVLVVQGITTEESGFGYVTETDVSEM